MVNTYAIGYAGSLVVVVVGGTQIFCVSVYSRKGIVPGAFSSVRSAPLTMHTCLVFHVSC